jgi:hypothetical protein
MDNKIPPQLEKGWKIFCDWRDARARGGDPLPPGGFFFLGPRDALLDELFLLRENLETATGCEVDVDVEQKGDQIIPKVTVKSEDPKHEEDVERLCEEFRARVNERLQAVNDVPAHLQVMHVKDLLT